MLKRMLSLVGLRSRLTPSKNLIVVITGCDSGLGFRVAQAAHDAGLTVVAGMFTGDSGEGAIRLRALCPTPGLKMIPMDVTKDSNVVDTMNYVEDLIKNNPEYVLHAVFNNAGVMTFGEFEWQTPEIIEQQVQVNLLGTWRVAKAALPLLRSSSSRGHKPRLISCGSHCSIQPLPGLATYAASKSAGRAWCEALRMELKPYGVQVVNFIPGSMVMNTNILSRQNQYASKMKDSFTREQLEYYGEYFDRFMGYLENISALRSPDLLQDSVLIDKVMDAILEESPSAEYKHQPWRYAIYHFLFAISPIALRQWLVRKFITLPQY